MGTKVLWASFTFAIAVETRHGRGTASFKRVAEYVQVDGHVVLLLIAIRKVWQSN
jgi:hypothetical protein